MSTPSTPEQRVFISYATEDRSRVVPLVRRLKQLGIFHWFDQLELRPGDPLTSRIQAGIANATALAVMLSPYSVQSAWVKKEIAHALKLERSDGRVRVIPCMLESCTIPKNLKNRLLCDFTKTFTEGLRNLLQGIFRDLRVITCKIDPNHPLRLEPLHLRTELESIFQLAGHSQRILPLLIREDFEYETSELLANAPLRWNEAWEVEARRIPAFRFSNLEAFLGMVATAFQESNISPLSTTERISEVIQRCCTFVLYDIWRTLINHLDRGRLESLRSVSAKAVLEEMEKITKLCPSGPNIEAHVFGYQCKELIDVEFAARNPKHYSRAWVPNKIIKEDTRQFWRFPGCAPSMELFPEEWLLYVVPGIVRHLTSIWSNKGQLIGEHREFVSVDINDYVHMGPP